MLFGTISYQDARLPDQYFVNQDSAFSFASSYLQTSPSQTVQQTAWTSTQSVTDSTAEYTVSLFGVVPIKTVSVTAVETQTLIPSGISFGVKMFTQGAMVVGFEDVITATGTACPAADAGFEVGDLIQSVNGNSISRNDEIAYWLQAQGDSPSIVEVLREDELITLTLQAVEAVDGAYRSGIWVRDSAAGIGTLTFIDPDTNTFGGLGHAICDVDTGQILSVGSGEICQVEIYNVIAGTVGSPGQLQGIFTDADSLGSLFLNTETGIFGSMYNATEAEALEVGYQQEIEVGSATILCTLDGDEVGEYDIEIVSIDYLSDAQTQNMVIEVTDPDLLAVTGGIVQGMSGSPILQNGKIIGAVTHVFVNDPAMGYGILIENMLETVDAQI